MNHVNGTGKDGRILKEDVLKYLQEKKDGGTSPLPPPSPQPCVTPSPPPPTATPLPPPPPKPIVIKPVLDKDRTEPIKGFAKIMVKTMTASKVSGF